MDQFAIAVTGAVAIWLTQCASDRLRRWACVVGLAGQPFWLAATFSEGQWGMFGLSVFYTLAWCRGLWTHWVGAWFTNVANFAHLTRIGRFLR